MKKVLLFVAVLLATTNTVFGYGKNQDSEIKDHGIADIQLSQPKEAVINSSGLTQEIVLVVTREELFAMTEEDSIVSSKLNPVQKGNSVLTIKTHDEISLALVSSDRSTNLFGSEIYEQQNKDWMFKNRATFY